MGIERCLACNESLETQLLQPAAITETKSAPASAPWCAECLLDPAEGGRTFKVADDFMLPW